MIDLEHSPLGGSSAYRFLTCAFSFLEHRRQLMSNTFVEIPSEFSALGVAAHELGATCLTDGSEPFEHFGETFGNYRAGWEDEIDLDAVAVYVNKCRELLSTAGMVDGTKLYIEQTFHLPKIHRLLKGTVDFGLINALGLWLVDYKNGEGVGVEATDSEQLLYYAFLLILANWDWMQRQPKNFPVHLCIVQPNFYGIFEEPEVWETTLGDVVAWGYDVLLPRMNELMNTPVEEQGEATPGDHCQFCPVTLHCPKLKAAFEEYADAEEDFVTMLNDQELTELYSKREYARRFMTALERVVYARKVTGGNIPSAKLVEKKIARVWKPGAPLLETFGEKAYEPRKLKSPAGIEKLSSRGKEIAKEWGYKPETHGLTIAPLSDPRPEAAPRTNDTVFAAFKQSYDEMGF